ncbi:MAG TPA: hypothetical protein VGR31_12095 [Planctomycetota bacterium]|jgi:hypothetical protein|nr:hypothetical protein [Planctomycetota bacterium]
MLSGGRAATPFRPKTDAGFVDAARHVLAETRALHRLDGETLVLDRALFLPLGQVGSGDKETVRFRQVVRGVPVVGGFVNVLFAADGSLLSIQASGLPDLATQETRPALPARRALDRAAQEFRALAGALPTRLSEPALVIERHLGADGLRRPRLAWQVDAQRIDAGSAPEGRTLWIDAADGAVIRSENNIHSFDVGGTVQSLATPGTLPDTPANPATAQPMKYLLVQSAAGTVLTDASGNFDFPGVNAPLDCTFSYTGPVNAIGNAAGPNYSLTQTLLPGVANAVLMNAGASPDVTAQANVFATIDRQRDWVRSINPADDTLDFQHLAIVNIASACNAYFDGSGIYFYDAGSGCPNMAYSTIVSHEDGHWANQLYGTGNGPDGMGEGNADAWAEYVWDTPVVGAGFFGSGNDLRTGLNTRPFCGDCCGGCYGEVHTDGEVWMGTAWKVRARLVASNGPAAGTLIANTLFLAWMESYNQSQIKSIIETQWLTLDDADGNVDNGTPHFADIDLGFRDQGFPGFVPAPVSFGPVTDVADTEVQALPAVVNATIRANAAPPLTTAVVRYRVNGGAFQDVPLANVGGDEFQATLPGELAPAHVEYYVAATDSAAHSATYPSHAPASLLDYDVGAKHVLRLDHFDESSNLGWTHGTYGDTSNPEDDWQRGASSGKYGVAGGIAWTDPTHAVSGGACWGNDLGHFANTGAYSADVHAWLRSPSVDCSNAVGTQLRFMRWLSVEDSSHDQARVLVNGVPVFANPATSLADEEWTNQTLDISAVADHQASVQIEFELRTDGATELGGWQLDDVELLWVSVPPCPTPVNDCVQSPNSADPQGAVMGWSGSTLVSHDDLVLRTTGCPPDKTCLFLYGRNDTFVPFGNGVRCVATPFHRLPSLHTDAGGAVAFPLDLTHLPPNGQIAAGEDWLFQLVFRDPAAGGLRFNCSDSLRVSFCP